MKQRKSNQSSLTVNVTFNSPFYSCVLSDLAFEWKRDLRVDFVLIQTLLLFLCRIVYIKTRSTSASIRLKGQVTNHTTVKCTIGASLTHDWCNMFILFAGVKISDWKAKGSECDKCSDGGGGPFVIEGNCEAQSGYNCKGVKTTKESTDCVTYCGGGTMNQ